MPRSHLALIIALLAAPAAAQDKGREAYVTDCSACHQENGKGVDGSFPALAGSAFVNGAPGPVIATVLKGRGAMPAFGGDLSDGEVAAVISYIRGAWGNHGGPVTPAEAAAARRR